MPTKLKGRWTGSNRQFYDKLQTRKSHCSSRQAREPTTPSKYPGRLEHYQRYYSPKLYKSQLRHGPSSVVAADSFHSLKKKLIVIKRTEPSIKQEVLKKPLLFLRSKISLHRTPSPASRCSPTQLHVNIGTENTQSVDAFCNHS